MAPRPLPPEIHARVLVDEMRLYRACRSPGADPRVESFRSHYELQRPPRGVETWATVLHMAVSMFQAPEQCWNLIERTRGRIGDRVAELLLGPGHGICVARTGGSGHWSVWARPDALRAAVQRLEAG